MARIVLGLGTSHGPMLSVPPEAWAERVPADRSNTELPFRGRNYSFEELMTLRRSDGLENKITPAECRDRHARCQSAIHKLGDILLATKPAVAVMIGNDQMEVFDSGHVPALAVFWGPYVEGIPRTPEFLAKLPPGIARAELDRTPQVYTQYPCLPDLAKHILENVVAEGFDAAQLTRLPEGAIGSRAVPHAWGFVFRRVMRDNVIPHVPVFVNTFYPPNQPTAKRCIEFGQAIARAIASWGDDRSVAIIASGGLSHFVIDESFDREVLDAMQAGDVRKLSALPESFLQAGTSEIKNWLVGAGILTAAGLRMKVVDYVPCYRSAAGTGSAMGFAVWQ